MFSNDWIMPRRAGGSYGNPQTCKTSHKYLACHIGIAWFIWLYKPIINLQSQTNTHADKSSEKSLSNYRSSTVATCSSYSY